jgi:hypothetical protein
MVGLLFLGLAVVQTFGVLDGWRPESSAPRQLALERRVEIAGLYATLTFVCLTLGGVLLLAAICHHLPALVPGAMCGTGVLQAAGLPGWRALGFRGLTLLILGIARLVNGINQRTPTAPLAPPLAKTLLLALPFYGWTLWDTARAFLALAPHAPVSCCAVVYSQVAPATRTGGIIPLPTPLLVGALSLLSGVILLLLYTGRRSGCGHRTALPLLAATLLWLPLAGTVLLDHFAAYHFEVLAHRCPWCLFLPEHRLVGYPLLVAFLLLGMEAQVPWLAPQLVHRNPVSEPAVVQRLKRGRSRMAIALAVYWLVGGLPALIWRLRFGVWLG